MIIQASTTQIASITSTNVGNVTISSTKENQQGTSSINSQADSLVISAKGMSLFAESQKLASSALDAINQNATDSTSSTSSNTNANSITSSTTEADDDDSTATSDLSGYSDAQLKQLVADGTISEAEATAEIAKRKGSDDAKQNNLATFSYPDTHIDTLV